ncbi:MAG: DNRLRE domain-containing protein [Planctomycetaceae bacterium]|nr:DNRLRE domain-containing protein [Planctomycetaceae bacterium]
MRVLLPVTVLFLTCGIAAAATISVSGLSDVQDTFVRHDAAATNYGSQGGLSVSGATALNKFGAIAGVAETFMKFDVSSAFDAFNTQYGVGNWHLTAATLLLVEQGLANNAAFSTGAGQFRVQYLADDSWSASTLTWNNSRTLAGSAGSFLGTFANVGDGDQRTSLRTFELDLVADLSADVASGGTISFYLSPASDTVGFTFNSTNITSTPTDIRPMPVLELTAVPEPVSLALLAAAGLALLRTERKGTAA